MRGQGSSGSCPRLDAHPVALPVLMKRGNSIVTGGVPVCDLLPQRSFTHPRILRECQNLCCEPIKDPQGYFMSCGSLISLGVVELDINKTCRFAKLCERFWRQRWAQVPSFCWSARAISSKSLASALSMNR